MTSDFIVPELGLGLIGIGRPWGHRFRGLPNEEQAHELLATALELGITFWDTAASYGSSETRIGAFLRSRPAGDLARVFIATKFGDHWEPGAEDSYMDHSFDALRRSLDRSLERLPRIDLLQVHRARAATLRDPEVHRALEYARAQGVRALGASVKGVDAAQAALGAGVFTWLQMPYNLAFPDLAPVFEMARERGVRIIVNRPFAEGALLYDAQGENQGNAARIQALRFVMEQEFAGVVIAGTSSAEHLRENAACFGAAK